MEQHKVKSLIMIVIFLLIILLPVSVIIMREIGYKAKAAREAAPVTAPADRR